MKESLVLHLYFLYLCIVNEDKNLRPTREIFLAHGRDKKVLRTGADDLRI